MLACVTTRLEAEVEQARLKEREVMMKELEHMKKALEDEKMSVYTQVHNLEEQLVCDHSCSHTLSASFIHEVYCLGYQFNSTDNHSPNFIRI